MVNYLRWVVNSKWRALVGLSLFACESIKAFRDSAIWTGNFLGDLMWTIQPYVILNSTTFIAPIQLPVTLLPEPAVVSALHTNTEDNDQRTSSSSNSSKQPQASFSPEGPRRRSRGNKKSPAKKRR